MHVSPTTSPASSSSLRWHDGTRGFSLVELAIVLVILGLLAGGIMAGRSLIRAAELRSASAQLLSYRTSIYGFRDKYLALPGDMVNATEFWGAQAGSPGRGVDPDCAAIPPTSPATDARTCNGNGDGMVTSQGTNNYENFRFWQHLANAGLIEGHYSGVRGPNASWHSIPGVNIPPGRIAQSGFGIYYRTAITNNSNAQWWNGTAATHVIYFGKGGAGNPHAPLLTPAETWSIDTKIDDGRPAFGRIVAFKSTYAELLGCTSSDDPQAAAYSLDADDIRCALGMKLGF